MKGINSKELCKQIKSRSLHRLTWSRNDGMHYITNHHWMVRYADGLIPRDVLVSLFSVFARIPNEGRAVIRFRGGDDMEREAVDTSPIFEQVNKCKDVGRITPFIKDTGTIQMRVIQCEKYFVYVNEFYARLLDGEHRPMCGGEISPVSFFDGGLVILPYRNGTEGNERAALLELLAS